MVRRFILYFFGVALGCMLVYVTLIKDKNRNFGGWLPDNRVLNQLKKSELFLENDVKCIIECLGANETLVHNALDDGTVDFENSEPRKTPKKYKIDFESSAYGELELIFQWHKKDVKLIEISGEQTKNCACDETE